MKELKIHETVDMFTVMTIGFASTDILASIAVMEEAIAGSHHLSPYAISRVMSAIMKSSRDRSSYGPPVVLSTSLVQRITAVIMALPVPEERAKRELLSTQLIELHGRVRELVAVMKYWKMAM